MTIDQPEFNVLQNLYFESSYQASLLMLRNIIYWIEKKVLLYTQGLSFSRRFLDSLAVRSTKIILRLVKHISSHFNKKSVLDIIILYAAIFFWLFEIHVFWQLGSYSLSLNFFVTSSNFSSSTPELTPRSKKNSPEIQIWVVYYFNLEVIVAGRQTLAPVLSPLWGKLDNRLFIERNRVREGECSCVWEADREKSFLI